MSRSDDIPYTLRISTRARRCRVQVEPDGVVLVVPHRMAVARAESFLRSQADWIRRQLSRAHRRAQLLPDGHLLYRGRPAPLRVVETAVSRPHVRHEADGFAVYVPGGRAADARRALESHLRREAVRVLEAEVAAQSSRTGLRPTSISVRDQRTRWGSCSRRGRISLSWRLLLAPPEVLAYVVIHELAHLAEPNHGPGFWRLVANLCPGFAEHRDWLKRHGTLLHRPAPSGL